MSVDHAFWRWKCGCSSERSALRGQRSAFDPSADSWPLRAFLPTVPIFATSAALRISLPDQYSAPPFSSAPEPRKNCQVVPAPILIRSGHARNRASDEGPIATLVPHPENRLSPKAGNPTAHVPPQDSDRLPARLLPVFPSRQADWRLPVTAARNSLSAAPASPLPMNRAAR